MKPIPVIVSILITVVLIELISVVFPLDIFCFWWLAAGFVAVIIYRAITKDKPLPSLTQGMLIGLITGLIISLTRGVLIFFNINLAAASLEHVFNEIVLLPLWSVIGNPETHTLYPALFLSLVCWGLFGLLGGLIGAAIFRKSPAPEAETPTLSLTNAPAISDKRIWILINTVIVLVCIILFALVPTALSRIPPKLPPPVPLLDPPQNAVEILGIDTSGGFLVADLYIRANDGKVYLYTDQGGGFHWEPVKKPKNNDAADCPKRVIPVLEASAGKIIDCQVVQPAGEWGAPDLIAYALSSSNEIWKIKIPQTDYLLIIVGTICLATIGLAVGLIIVGIRKILRDRRIKKSGDMNPSSPVIPV